MTSESFLISQYLLKLYISEAVVRLEKEREREKKRQRNRRRIRSKLDKL